MSLRATREAPFDATQGQVRLAQAPAALPRLAIRTDACRGRGEAPMVAGMPSHADDVTLIGLLLDGFEKNESIRGWHWRELPAPDEATAVTRFQAAPERESRRAQPVRSDEPSGKPCRGAAASAVIIPSSHP